MKNFYTLNKTSFFSKTVYLFIIYGRYYNIGNWADHKMALCTVIKFF